MVHQISKDGDITVKARTDSMEMMMVGTITSKIKESTDGTYR